MIIGTPKEIKNHEYRVGLIPSGVQALKADGHDVLIETNAGKGSGFTDAEYVEAGAEIVQTAAEVFQRADMIIKVKEPQKIEYEQLRENQILFTYLHLAPDPDQTQVLIKSKCIGIAYETITGESPRDLPLLTPMSEVAGRMSVQVGAHFLLAPNGGLGMLLGGVPGTERAEVLIIGGGVVGLNAAKMAVGLGARVTILERSAKRMREIDDIFGSQVTCLMSNDYNIEHQLPKADLVIGAVLIPGAAAPKLITEKMIKKYMKPGSVIVDVAVDQGGCVENTRPTTHEDPTFKVGDVIMYCVANMPGAAPRTSTLALTNVTLPYAQQIAKLGAEGAAKANAGLAEGFNTYKGHVVNQPVAESQNLAYTDLATLIG